ncbi:MAG TPA: PAS domain-containing protein [Gemmatimonadaceae bacterium]|nr:PAS domain-containing protein [Gemmatimonadaceae bacterium]
MTETDIAHAHTGAELAARLDALAPGEALSVLADLAEAVFPSGLGDLAQVTWEGTVTPPSVPAVHTQPSRSQQPADDARLRAAELRYRTLVEQIPAVTFLAALDQGQENDMYVSPHIEALLGFTQKEWLDNPILWYTQLHPDDRALWLEEFARGCRTGGPFRAECRMLARDGRVVWVRGEARLIKDEMGRPLFLQGVAFDITESKQAQARVLRQAVQRTEQHYRDLVERLGAIFWEAEPRSGRFSFVSRGTERLLGCPLHRWLDEPEYWISLVHPDDRDQVIAQWHQALAERRDREFEFRAVTADNRVVWLRNSIHFPASDDGDARPLGVMLDITEQKRTEEQLARMLVSAQTARTDAEAANRVKDEFLATMSHELRTPVNAVLGWSNILETGAGGGPMRDRAVEAIKRNAQAQVQIIEDLLDVSRIVTGKLHLEIKRVELTGIIEAALDTVKLAANAKHLSVLTTLDAPSAMVLGDAGRLRQVVSNLLTNAVKFTPQGGRIDIGLTVANGMARIRVADTGQGIDAEFLPHVFDRFRQADGSSTRTHGGLGLGLAIVRHLTELHGGRVGAESQGPGLGAIFTVELPLDVTAEPGAAHPGGHDAAAHDAADDPVLALRDARVLVVDDDPDALEVLAAFLARAGADVSPASCASDALRLLQDCPFDLLVCDIAMPGADGFELIRGVRAGNGPNAGIPAAAVTAYAREADRERALVAGFQAHIAKPIDVHNALAAMGRLVEMRLAP